MSVALLFSGLLESSSADIFMLPLRAVSNRCSEDCERFRAFCAEPRIPSRLKLGVRADLIEVGDLSGFVPLVAVFNMGEGISMEKSLGGTTKGRVTLVEAAEARIPDAERGESPFDEGDMLEGGRYKSSAVDVMGKLGSRKSSLGSGGRPR